MFHHSGTLGGGWIAPGGWIFVEYFFILSGYFMTKHFDIRDAENDISEQTALVYTLRKLLKTMPYAAAGICLDLIAQIGCGHIRPDRIGNAVAELPIHFLLLKGLGITLFDLNGPLWYLTGILMAMPWLIVMQLRYRVFYKYLVSWAFPLMIYTMIFTVNGNIQYWGEGWAVNCMLRAFAGLMLGSFTYYISEHIRTLDLSDKIRGLLSVLEVALFVALISWSFATDSFEYSIPSILFSIITLCIAFSGQERIQAHIPHWANTAGRLSMSMYCLHIPVFDLVRWLCSGVPFEGKLCIGIGLTILLSAIMILLVDRLTNPNNKGVTAHSG